MAQFQKGTSGNPTGRPTGARNKLSENFIDALFADWQEHGPAAIAKVREEKPEQYLKVVASLVPRDFNVKVGSAADDMTDEELEASIRMLTKSLRDQGLELDEDALPILPNSTEH